MLAVNPGRVATPERQPPPDLVRDQMTDPLTPSCGLTEAPGRVNREASATNPRVHPICARSATLNVRRLPLKEDAGRAQ
ncbi:hypothetical protein MDOR_29370 [Mycolicibacterium doricum]|uniref:Uncharacterized protein n=1 Tax=Mycolicibacterium doricum TaxID=126673 RepID=A0A7I7VZ16_9MYCO|nr:hypothetical protein MDOR_29370 [Mycolicibacterium doricum]